MSVNACFFGRSALFLSLRGGKNIKNLDPELIATVRTALKGNKLEKFDASISVLNESLAQGTWTLRGSVKANSGFYQGIPKARVSSIWENTVEYRSP